MSLPKTEQRRLDIIKACIAYIIEFGDAAALKCDPPITRADLESLKTGMEKILPVDMEKGIELLSDHLPTQTTLSLPATLPVGSEAIIVSFVIKRHSDRELTYGIVTAQVFQRELQGENAFREALTRAITIWINTDPEGQKTWNYSGGDFNLGDLAGHIPPNELFASALASVGIHDLSVEVEPQNAPCKHWSYDTVLVNVSQEV